STPQVCQAVSLSSRRQSCGAGPLPVASNIPRSQKTTPPNALSPAGSARRSEQVTEALPLTVTVLDEKQLAEGGYGGIIGVGQGSARPPRLIRIEYAPEGASSSEIGRAHV